MSLLRCALLDQYFLSHVRDLHVVGGWGELLGSILITATVLILIDQKFVQL